MRAIREVKAKWAWAALTQPRAACRGNQEQLAAVLPKGHFSDDPSSQFENFVLYLDQKYPPIQANADGILEDYGLPFMVRDKKIDKDIFFRFVLYKVLTYGHLLLEEKYQDFFRYYIFLPLNIPELMGIPDLTVERLRRKTMRDDKPFDLRVWMLKTFKRCDVQVQMMLFGGTIMEFDFVGPRIDIGGYRVTPTDLPAEDPMVDPMIVSPSKHISPGLDFSMDFSVLPPIFHTLMSDEFVKEYGEAYTLVVPSEDANRRALVHRLIPNSERTAENQYFVLPDWIIEQLMAALQPGHGFDTTQSGTELAGMLASIVNIQTPQVPRHMSQDTSTPVASQSDASNAETSGMPSGGTAGDAME